MDYRHIQYMYSQTNRENRPILVHDISIAMMLQITLSMVAKMIGCSCDEVKYQERIVNTNKFIT